MGETRLLKRQTDRANPSLNTVSTFDFRQKGRVMVITHVVPSDNKIRAVRVYKRKGIKTRTTSGC